MPELWGSAKVGAFIRVARARANRYLILARVRRESRFLMLIRGRSRPYVDLPAWSLTEMDSFELNKILGALLATCLVCWSTNFAAGAIFTPAMPEKPGFEIAVTEEPARRRPGSRGGSRPSRSRSCCQTASVEKGEAAAKKCAACHTFEKGGPTASVRISTAS